MLASLAALTKQVHGEVLEVLGETGHRRRISALPLGAEAVHAPARLFQGKFARRLFDPVEDLPPVGLEGVLVGLGDLRGRIAEPVDDAMPAERGGKDQLDHGDQPRRALGDDEQRRVKTAGGESLEEVPPGVR